MMVTLVDSVHQQEFCSLLGGPFHLTRPLCTWNLCVGPEWFDCRHKAAMLHFLLGIVAVPASILELLLRHPIDRLLYPPVFSVPEHEQGPDHIAGQAGLLPAFALFPRVPPLPALHLHRTGTCEGAVVQLVEVEKFLAGALNAFVRGEPHLTQKHQGPNRGCPLGSVESLLGWPESVLCPSLQDLSHRRIFSDLLSGLKHFLTVRRPSKDVMKSKLSNRRILSLQQPV